MIVVISVNADRKSFRMAAKKRNHRLFAPIVIPGYESNRRMKIMRFHLREQTFVIQVTIRLAQPRVIDRQVGVMMERMPASIAGAVFCKDHHRSNFRKYGFCTFGGSLDLFVWWAFFAKQESSLLVHFDFQEDRSDFCAVV